MVDIALVVVVGLSEVVGTSVVVIFSVGVVLSVTVVTGTLVVMTLCEVLNVDGNLYTCVAVSILMLYMCGLISYYL